MLIPLAVRLAYGLDADEAALDVEHVPSNINATYFVRRRAEPAAPPLVLQRLHPVFGPNVHVDIQAVTAHLAARGLTTPRLVPTIDGELWLRDDSEAAPRVWRALTFIDGLETVSAELSSRFAADTIVDSYWGWDPTRFASRRDHNLLRARGQLALSLSVRASRGALVTALASAARERSPAQP